MLIDSTLLDRTCFTPPDFPLSSAVFAAGMNTCVRRIRCQNLTILLSCSDRYAVCSFPFADILPGAGGTVPFVLFSSVASGISFPCISPSHFSCLFGRSSVASVGPLCPPVGNVYSFLPLHSASCVCVMCAGRECQYRKVKESLSREA